MKYILDIIIITLITIVFLIDINMKEKSKTHQIAMFVNFLILYMRYFLR